MRIFKKKKKIKTVQKNQYDTLESIWTRLFVPHVRVFKNTGGINQTTLRFSTNEMEKPEPSASL